MAGLHSGGSCRGSSSGRPPRCQAVGLSPPTWPATSSIHTVHKQTCKQATLFFDGTRPQREPHAATAGLGCCCCCCHWHHFAARKIPVTGAHVPLLILHMKRLLNVCAVSACCCVSCNTCLRLGSSCKKKKKKKDYEDALWSA